MSYVFLPDAQEEFFEAVFHYEFHEEGLGSRFRQEVEHVIQRILADPFLWRERSGGYRRVNCPVFPYYICYFIRGQTIIIAAVAHGSRKPNYWKNRL